MFVVYYRIRCYYNNGAIVAECGKINIWRIYGV